MNMNILSLNNSKFSTSTNSMSSQNKKQHQQQVTILNLNEALALQCQVNQNQHQTQNQKLLPLHMKSRICSPSSSSTRDGRTGRSIMKKQTFSSSTSSRTSIDSFASSTSTMGASGRSKKTVVSFPKYSCVLQRVIPTLHHNDYTAAERRAAWYSAREIRSLEMEQKAIVQLMDEGELDLDTADEDVIVALARCPTTTCADDSTDRGEQQQECKEDYYPRGLEAKTQEGNRERTLAIINSVCAVLGEQEDSSVAAMSSRMPGGSCFSSSRTPDLDEALARTYRRYTLQSQNKALERAMYDQLAARSSYYC